MNDLKADLQAMYTKAGVKDEGVLFLFTDGQITNEKFLVFINDLLASGGICWAVPGSNRRVELRISNKYLVGGFPGT